MEKRSRFLLMMSLLLTMALATQCTMPEERTSSPATSEWQERPSLPQEPAPPAPPQESANPSPSSESASAEEMVVPATCRNGFRDGKETDADCGGPCDPCAYGRQCASTADCAENLSCDYRSKRCLQRKY